MLRIFLGLSLLITNMTVFAFGFAAGNDFDFKPLIAQTINDGKSWSLQDINGVTDSGVFETSACSDEICVAAGNAMFDDDVFVLIQTVDNGAHWDAVNLPGVLGGPFFYGSSCSGNTCVVVGFDDVDYNVNFPVLVQTTNGGASWSQIDLSSIITTEGWLKAVKCIDDFCAAVGTDGIIQTTDHGATWVKEKTITGNFYAIDCTETQCVAVGRTDDRHPYIVRLDRASGRWISENIASDLSGMFVSVSCNDNKCVAAGNAESKIFFTGMGNVENKFFLAESSITSKEWQYQNIEGIPAGVLVNVDCNNQYCYAVGNSVLVCGEVSCDMIGHAMILSDRSGSWLREKLPNEIIATNPNQNFLQSVNCNDNDYCFIAGRFNYSPILLQTDKNHEWNMVKVPRMPSDGDLSTGSLK